MTITKHRKMVGQYFAHGYKLELFEYGKETFADIESPNGPYCPVILVDDSSEDFGGFTFKVEEFPFTGGGSDLDEADYESYLRGLRNAYDAVQVFEEEMYFYHQ